MSNFLLGGRMGDLIHQLWVVKNTPGKHDLFITDNRDLHSDGFILPLNETKNELFPIIMNQDYVQYFGCFNFCEGYNMDGITNLSLWRRHAYSASWTQLLSNTFNVPVNGDPWITWEKKQAWKEIIIIHRSVHNARRGHNWEMIMDKYQGQCVFVGTAEEYLQFNFKIPYYWPRDLSEYFTIINSCKFFIGNQSMPLAIAHSLGTPRLAMLNEVDKIAYKGEEQWHPNFYWIAENEHFFEGINY